MGRYRETARFEFNTCNTVDDVTGAITKLNNTRKRWDGVRVTDLNYEDRQPQDFAVFPRPSVAYIDSRSDRQDPTPVPYNPANGWNPTP